MIAINLLGEIFVDSCCRCLTCAHSGDNGCCAGNCVTACEDALTGGLAGALFNDDAAMLVDIEALGGGLDEGVGAGADSYNNGINIEYEFAALNGDGTAATLFIGFAELHADALYAGNEAVLGIAPVIGIVVAEDLNGVVEKAEVNAFLHCMLDLFLPCRKLFEGTPVYDVDMLCAETECSPCIIHSNVAAADDCYVAALHDGGNGIIEICLHEVGTGEELIGGVNALVCLAGDIHEVGKTCAGAYEYSFKALLEKLINGEGLADNDVGLNINAHSDEVVNFLLDDLLGETKLGDTIDENAACGMESFVNGNFIALSCKVACAGEAGGAGTYDSYAMAV